MPGWRSPAVYPHIWCKNGSQERCVGRPCVLGGGGSKEDVLKDVKCQVDSSLQKALLDSFSNS